MVVQPAHRWRGSVALRRALEGVQYFCSVSMLMLSVERLVARSIHFVGEGVSVVCSVGAWEAEPAFDVHRCAERVRNERLSISYSKRSGIRLKPCHIGQLANCLLDQCRRRGWSGRVFCKAHLYVSFCFIKMLGLPYRTSIVCNERRARATTGCAISYQYATKINISAAERKVAFATLMVEWSQPIFCTSGAAWWTCSRGIAWSDIPSSIRRRLLSSCWMFVPIFAIDDCPVNWLIFFGSWISNPIWVVIGMSKSLNVSWEWSRRPTSRGCHSFGHLAVSKVKNRNCLVGGSVSTGFNITRILFKTLTERE